MTSLLTDIDEILKTLYEDEVPEVGFEDNVLWAITPKYTGFKGRDKSIPLRFGRSPGVSHLFATARTNAGSSPYAEWRLTRRKSYGVVQFDGEAFEAADGEGAQVKYVDDEVKAMQANMTHRLNRDLYGNGGGAFGRLLAAGAGGGSTTITVQDPLSLIAVERNMFIVSSNTDGTSGSPDANPTRIGGLDRVAGTLTTVSGNWNAVAGFSDNDYLFVAGDFGIAMSGLGAWLPSSNPSATTFFGQDRTEDLLRLSGQRITAVASDGTLANFLDRAATECYLQGHGSRTMKFVTNPRHVSQLRRELGSQVEYTRTPAMTQNGPHAEIGFRSIGLSTANVDVDVLGDRDCPLNVGYLLDMSSIGFHALGVAGPHMLTYGGGEYLRMSDEDSIEGRMGWRGNFCVGRPGHNAYCNLTALTT